jgi:hypothetical protein
MFGFITKEKVSKVKPQVVNPFQPIVDVGTVFSYVKATWNGEVMSFSLNTNTVQESKFALEEVRLLKKTILAVKKEKRAQMSEIRQVRTDRVANRSAMIPGFGKLGTVLRFAVRSARAEERGNVSSIIKEIQDSTITPLDKMLLVCDKFEIILKKEILGG